MSVTEREELDHCPDCSLPFEIAAVSLRFFRKAAMLSVCPNCGLMRTDGCEARLTIRDRLDALDKKLAIGPSRLLPLGEPLAAKASDGPGTVHLAPAVSASSRNVRMAAGTRSSANAAVQHPPKQAGSQFRSRTAEV
jgi:hypothetical protein